jgi:RHS repeat-associated protein
LHLFDKTNGAYPSTTPGYAQRLAGTQNEKYGLAQSLSVMPGDTIRMEVFGKYVGSTSENSQALNDFISSIMLGTAPAGVVVDGGGYGSSTSSFTYGGYLNHPGSGDSAPMAYLNYIMFDRDFNPILTDVSQSNFVKISTAAKETGADGPHERLFAEVIAKKAGYLYIYLSNDNPTPVDVFFDNFKVEHVKSPIVQMDDYYPFGLSFNSYQRENSVPNKLKFGGKEEQSDLSLNTIDWGWRQYDPSIGRWSVIDQWAEKYATNSPYAFVSNNPVVNKEIDGRWYNEKDEKKAQRYEKKLEKRIAKLEKQVAKLEGKGKNTGDRTERIAEMKQSKTDFSDMRKSDTQFRFANLSDKFNPVRDVNGNGLPVTARTGNNQITMFMEKNNFHEPRHGGQIARGEYDVSVTGQTSRTFGAADEISAYRAEYSYRGSITYQPGLDLTNIQDIMKIGTNQTINNINQITPDFLKTLVDTPGVNQQYIYRDNPASWWSN